MTDFFAAQAALKRRSLLLVALWVMAVLAITLGVYTVVWVLWSSHSTLKSFWDPVLFPTVTLITLGMIGIGTASRLVQLRSGGDAVAQMLGGLPLESWGHEKNLEGRILRNVAEEMASASGCPLPGLYVLAQEPGINAFAAGWTPQDAVVGVTAGALEYLNRDELQGVVAHEFSHIAHGDTRLNGRLLASIAGLVALATVGRVLIEVAIRSRYRTGLARKSRGKGDGRGFILVLGLTLYVLGWIGVFFGRLLQAAVSRQREYLADTAAVQYTRNPLGLAGALKKLGGLLEGSRVRQAHAEEAAHLFFSTPRSSLSELLFSTHPPLDKRIRRLDPTFDGRFPKVVKPSLEQRREELEAARAPQPLQAEAFAAVPLAPAEPPVAPVQQEPAARAGEGQRYRVEIQRVLSTAGNPGPEHLAYARQLATRVPRRLLEATRDPYEARALICALLLDRRQPQVRQRQLQEIARREDTKLLSRIEDLEQLLAQTGRRAWLPLAQLSLGALRQLSPAQYERLEGLMKALIEADQRVSLFEFALGTAVLQPLRAVFHKPVAGRRQPRVAEVTRAVRSLLGALVWSGHRSQDQAEKAYRKGLQRLPLALRACMDEKLPAAQECGVRELGAALSVLSSCPWQWRRSVLEAALEAIAYDDRVSLEEAELYRAVAISLGCPLPPVLPEALEQDIQPTAAGLLSQAQPS